MQSKLKTNHLFILLVTLILTLFPNINLKAQTPIVRAILFFKPSCGYCVELINEDLPPILEKYGEKLVIISIDITNPEGNQLRQLAAKHLNIPPERILVPMLIVGDVVLVGGVEIPESLPTIIEEGIASGGIDWPNIPEIQELIDNNISSIENNDSQGLGILEVGKFEDLSVNNSDDQFTLTTNDHQNISLGDDLRDNNLFDRFTNDLSGNIIATLTLIGMLFSVIFVGYLFITDRAIKIKPWPDWTIILFSILGLFVAVYLTFVETTNTEAICGPVGDCNTVQQSPYAMILGIIHVGVLGVIGYSLLLISWIIRYITSNQKIKSIFTLVVWGFAWFGVIFSIYLTFLEPFVIGATCLWCISSAILITLILIASTPYAITSLSSEENN